MTMRRLCLGLALLCLPLPGLADIEYGEFRVAHTPLELLSDGAEKIAGVISPEEVVSWEMYVPETYDPEKPAGLLVYISPIQSGEIPRQWKSVLDDHNLIWISANDSGNRVLLPRRVLLAILAPVVAARRYTITSNRMYLSGLSGGGKVASIVALDYPGTFNGAIYNCGVEAWDEQEPALIDQVRRNRYVFITGEYDQALEPTKRAFRKYRKAGVERSKLMVIDGMTHRNPDRHDFAKAILFLDAQE